MDIRKVSKNDFDKISNLQLQLDYTKIKFDYTLKKVKIILNNKKSNLVTDQIWLFCYNIFFNVLSSALLIIFLSNIGELLLYNI